MIAAVFYLLVFLVSGLHINAETVVQQQPKISQAQGVSSKKNLNKKVTAPQKKSKKSKPSAKPLAKTTPKKSAPTPVPQLKKTAPVIDDSSSDDDDDDKYLDQSSTTPQRDEATIKKSVVAAIDDADDDDDENSNSSENRKNLTPTLSQLKKVKDFPPEDKKVMIRVLLQEEPTEQKITFSIQSTDGFVLESPISSGKRARWNHEIIHLLAFKGNLFLLTEKGTYKRIASNELSIHSINGSLKIDNYTYNGSIHMRINPDSKRVQVVNKINLDDYIYSVLRYESLSYWPREMHRLQAVASRTYAVYQIKRSRALDGTTHFYDIKNTNHHQIYNGTHDFEHLREAVSDTHNLILTYNDDVALTMFDICCGGIVSAHMKKRDSDKPYLFRSSKCTYCKGKADYEWNYSFDMHALVQRMLACPRLEFRAKKIGKIKNITIKEKDKAGIVHRILLHGTRDNTIITHNDLKAMMSSKAFKSNAYSLSKDGDTISLKGYGFGHNIGLCQIGARTLVSKGWNYREILDFYFPNTSLMRLKVL